MFRIVSGLVSPRTARVSFEDPLEAFRFAWPGELVPGGMPGREDDGALDYVAAVLEVEPWAVEFDPADTDDTPIYRVGRCLWESAPRHDALGRALDEVVRYHPGGDPVAVLEFGAHRHGLPSTPPGVWQMRAAEGSRVDVWGDAEIVALEGSSVTAGGEAVVWAVGDCDIHAGGSSVVNIRTELARITLSENARAFSPWGAVFFAGQTPGVRAEMYRGGVWERLVD